MTRRTHGLVYVARVSLRNDFAIGVTSYANGEFIPYSGYLGGGAIHGHGRVVHDRTRPAVAPGWKVGFTTNLPLRMVSLSGCCGDVEIVALLAGPRSCEADAHRSLRECGALLAPQGPRGYHSYGCVREWYRDSQEFRAWLDGLAASWRGSIVYRPNRGESVPRDARSVEALLSSAFQREAAQ